MSNHVTKKAIDLYHRQRDRASQRREERAAERRRLYLENSERLRKQAERDKLIAFIVTLAWIIGIIGITLSNLHMILRMR